uniref:Uncharacterized protein n=1 Tax=Pararge aegeria TaxID=116150 RepID=S4PG91_9NEOP
MKGKTSLKLPTYIKHPPKLLDARLENRASKWCQFCYYYLLAVFIYWHHETNNAYRPVKCIINVLVLKSYFVICCFAFSQI